MTDIYVFDLPGVYDPFKVEWGTYRGDLGLKGVYVNPTTIPRAVLDVSPQKLYFLGEEEGPNPAPQTLSISNAGADILHWHATTDSEWVSIAPSEGVAPSSPKITADLSGLEYGSYHGEITVKGASYVEKSPQVVTVDLDVVSSIPVLSVDP